MKVNIWVIDDLRINYDLVLSSFPNDAEEYCNFFHFDKGMDAVNMLNKALESKDPELLPDIIFVDFYIEGDGWTGDKITTLIINLYKKFNMLNLKAHIIAFSSITRRNDDILKNGAVESIHKMDHNGVCHEIVNNFYDKEAILTYQRPRISLV